MKTREIRKMKNEDMSKRLSELRLELAKEFGNVRMGRAVKNPGKIRELRKSIARILTVQKEAKSPKSKQTVKSKQMIDKK